MTQLLLLISTLIFSSAITAQEKVVRFAIGEWPPYTSSSNDPEHSVHLDGRNSFSNEII